MVDTKPGNNSTYYVNHWNNIYGSSSPVGVQEWHISYKDVNKALDPYIKAVCRRVNDVPLEIIDVGCGRSNIGMDILRDYEMTKLLLTDYSSAVVEDLRARFEHDACVDVLEADCRQMSFRKSGSVPVLLDKGTLDALVGETDQLDMLRECGRILHPCGIFISISFPSVQRITFFDKNCTEIGLDWRLKVVGKGDPSEGHKTIFVFFLGIKEALAAVDAPAADELTQLCLSRIRKTGSLYIEENEFEAQSMQSLFACSSDSDVDFDGSG